jgi:polygalacturonase
MMKITRIFPVVLLFLVSIVRGADPPAFNVRDLGATGDGKTKDTAAFQKALDQCAAAGGRVDVPKGTYLIGSIELHSNTTLHFEDGAVLLGSPDLQEYPIIKIRWEGEWVDGHRGLIYASKAHDIAIEGPGKIQADEKLTGRTMPRRPVLIEPIECDNIRLDGFSTQHKTMWSIHPTLCTNFGAVNLTIRSSGGNGDGIDVDSCQHVKIDHCDIDTGDDCISLKSGRGLAAFRAAQATSDVLISHCKMGDSNFACIGIGSEDSGGIRDVRIEHCTFTHAKTDAIYIKSNTGRGANITNIMADDLDVTTTGFLRINLLDSGIRGNDPVPMPDGIPYAAGFSFTNVRVACKTLVDASKIAKEKPLTGLVLSNISGTAERGMTLVNITGANFSKLSITGLTGKRPLLEVANVMGTGLDGAIPYKEPATRPAGR